MFSNAATQQVAHSEIMRRHHQDQANPVGRGQGRTRAYLAVHWPGRAGASATVLPYPPHPAAGATRRRLFAQLLHIRLWAADRPDQR